MDGSSRCAWPTTGRQVRQGIKRPRPRGGGDLVARVHGSGTEGAALDDDGGGDYGDDDDDRDHDGNDHDHDVKL